MTELDQNTKAAGVGSHRQTDLKVAGPLPTALRISPGYSQNAREHHTCHRPPFVLSANAMTSLLIEGCLDCFCMRMFARGSDPLGRNYYDTVRQRTTHSIDIDPILLHLDMANKSGAQYDLLFVSIRFQEDRKRPWEKVDVKEIQTKIKSRYPSLGLIFVGPPAYDPEWLGDSEAARRNGGLVIESQDRTNPEIFDSVILEAIGGETAIARFRVTDFNQSAEAALERWMEERRKDDINKV